MRCIKVICSLLAFAALLLAEDGAPKSHSVEEANALRAVRSAPSADLRFAAIDHLLTSFPDTEYRAWVLSMAAGSLQKQVDYDQMMSFAERALKADPKNFRAMIILAYNLAAETTEFDPDRDEKLARIEKCAREAIELLKVAPAPNHEVPPNQWINARKDFTSQAEAALALVAAIRHREEEMIALRDDLDPVERQIKKATELSSSDAMKSRGELYLGLAADAQGDPSGALEHYKAVLSNAGAAESAKDLAQRRLRAATSGSAKQH